MSEEQMVIIDKTKGKYPFCIVWTPIPVLTWLFPILGHMGIALSNGSIQDFAASYTINENNMAFGKPTKYWQLRSSKANGSTLGWDHGITEASEIYKRRVHSLFCDNCHSYVATALNIMHYDNYTNWNMVRLALLITVHGKYVGFQGFLKTWLPFFMVVAVCIIIILLK